MSEERPPERDNLEYRDWNLDKPERQTITAQFVGGAFLGAFLVALGGLIGFLGVMSIGVTASSSAPHDRARLVVVFWSVAIVSALAMPRLWRRRRYVVAGFVCGAAVVGLCEGLCFAFG